MSFVFEVWNVTWAIDSGAIDSDSTERTVSLDSAVMNHQFGFQGTPSNRKRLTYGAMVESSESRRLRKCNDLSTDAPRRWME